MRLRILAALIAVAALATPAVAQEQHGAIEGTVKDSSGAVLPGVTVHLSGGAGVSVDAVSDTQGTYRFPSILPGTYTVTATLSGFKTEKVDNIPVDLGQIKKVDFSLGVASMSENVQVTAEPPIVDVKQSTKATDIAGDRVDLVPHNRDFTTMVTQAPGANNEPKSDGIMIDGSSAAENRYVVDGVETTNIIGGLSSKPVLSDFVDTVQVKSSGYPAEYGGSTGGVINVITKSGTNNFSGSALGYWQGSALTGSCNKASLAPNSVQGAASGSTPVQLTDNSPQPCGANPTLRRQLVNSNLAEFWTFPKDTSNLYQPGGSFGGPVMLNRSWFFVGYQPALTTTSRTANAVTSGNAKAVPQSATQHDQVQNLTADQTMQLGSKLRTRVAFNNSWEKVNGALPATGGTDPAGTNYATGTVNPNWTLSGQADYTLKSNLLLSARAGYFRQNQHSFGISNQTRFSFANSSIGIPGVPQADQFPSGYANIPTNSSTVFDLQERKFVQGDATWFGHLAGEHQVKGGFQADLRGENVNSGQQAQNITLDWGAQFANTGPQGVYGYYSVNSNLALPQEGEITQGKAASDVYGLFVQDTWSVTSKLTLNLGIRSESEKVPAYTSDNNDYGPYPIQFGFADKIAPRLGAAYDLFGDGRWKLYGDWGVFYDIFKLELSQGSFGGQKWVQYYYTLDTPNFTSLTGPNCPPACGGTPITSVNERLPSLSSTACLGPCIAPGIKPMRSQEASAGLEHQLNATSSVAFRYVHKQLDRGIEDTGSIVPFGPDANSEPYIIGNPGEGPTQTFNVINCNAAPGVPTCDVYAGSSGSLTLPKPKRNYDSGEFDYNKRFSHNWSLYGSYVLSRDYGNYPGLSESDENGRDSPNVGRLFDYPIEEMNGQGQPLYGDLPTDRRNQFKLQTVYSFPFGTTIGINQLADSGIPESRTAAVMPGHGYIFYFDGRGSDGRTPWLTQTDLYVQHAFKLGHSNRTFMVDVTVLNLLDQRTVLDYSNQIVLKSPDPAIDENALYAGNLNFQSELNGLIAANKLAVDPRFMNPSSWQAPRTVRFGAKFTF